MLSWNNCHSSLSQTFFFFFFVWKSHQLYCSREFLMQFQHFIGNLVLLIFMKYKHICFLSYIKATFHSTNCLKQVFFPAKKTPLIKTFIVRSFAALDSKGFIVSLYYWYHITPLGCYCRLASCLSGPSTVFWALGKRNTFSAIRSKPKLKKIK